MEVANPRVTSWRPSTRHEDTLTRAVLPLACPHRKFGDELRTKGGLLQFTNAFGTEHLLAVFDLTYVNVVTVNKPSARVWTTGSFSIASTSYATDTL